jgi:heterotetrameric sarcosine oxidase delta subunit
MRINCPICGERDQREFYYRGAALMRPDPDAGEGAWDEYVYLRDNPAGETRDLWYHVAGCSGWIVVTRNTLSHAITATELVENT